MVFSYFGEMFFSAVRSIYYDGRHKLLYLKECCCILENFRCLSLMHRRYEIRPAHCPVTPKRGNVNWLEDREFFSSNFRLVPRACIHVTPILDKVSGKWNVSKENLFTIPNALCLSRILCTPLIGWLTLCSCYKSALALLFLAGLTDLLDGNIARGYPTQASKLGSFLDPLADKLLVSTLFVTMTYMELIPIFITCLVVGRDLALIGASAVVRYKSFPTPFTWSDYFNIKLTTIQIQPPFISKLNTFLQLSLVFSSLAAASTGDPLLLQHPVFQCLRVSTAATTVGSAFWYIKRGRNHYR